MLGFQMYDKVHRIDVRLNMPTLTAKELKRLQWYTCKSHKTFNPSRTKKTRILSSFGQTIKRYT